MTGGDPSSCPTRLDSYVCVDVPRLDLRGARIIEREVRMKVVKRSFEIVVDTEGRWMGEGTECSNV